MQHATLKIAMAFVLGAALTGGISFAIAQPFDGAGGPQRSIMIHREIMHRFHDGWHRLGPAGAAIMDLKAIQRLYRFEGRRRDLVGLYHDVLSKTQNPEVRNYAYDHLARAEIKLTNTNQAVATLRQSLDENLARLNQTGTAKS
ncbi:MAG: hypothetical protein ACYDAV_12975 [Gammaproteobacteria bacterium]